MPSPAYNDTDTAFVSWIKKRQRWDVQTMWAYDTDLWPWRSPRLSVIRVEILVILWLFVFDFWATGPTRLRLITWPCDLDPWPWRSCGWCGSSSSIHMPSLKFVGLAIQKIWCTMCVSIRAWWPWSWSYDLETGMRVKSKVGNLPSKFGHARPLGSWIIHYVRDRRTDGRTKASLIASLAIVSSGLRSSWRCFVLWTHYIRRFKPHWPQIINEGEKLQSERTSAIRPESKQLLQSFPSVLTTDAIITSCFHALTVTASAIRSLRIHNFHLHLTNIIHTAWCPFHWSDVVSNSRPDFKTFSTFLQIKMSIYKMMLLHGLDK